MTNRVPNPATLRDAVEEVIQQNRDLHYPYLGRFIQKVGGKEGNALRQACEELIENPSAPEVMGKSPKAYSSLLTLEDLVVHSQHGKEWDIPDSTIEVAEAKVELWDKEVGYQRWSP